MKRWFPQAYTKVSSYFTKYPDVQACVWKLSDKCYLKFVNISHWGLKLGGDSCENFITSCIESETNDETSIFLMISTPFMEPILKAIIDSLKSRRGKFMGYFLLHDDSRCYGSYPTSLELYQKRARFLLGGDHVPLQTISCYKYGKSFSLAQGIENILLKTDKAILANTSTRENKQFQLVSLLKWGRPMDNFEPLKERRLSK